VLGPAGLRMVSGCVNFRTACDSKFGTLPANLIQNSWHKQSWHHISCLQTIGYAPDGSNKWCCSVVLAPACPMVSGHVNFLTAFGSKFWSKTHDTSNHDTVSVASRHMDMLHVGLISDVAVWCWLLLAWWCQAMSILVNNWLNVWHFNQQIWSKTHDTSNHDTKSVASRPLDMLQMGLISDVALWCWLLLAQWCQAV
jgi:hypothetical protein